MCTNANSAHNNTYTLNELISQIYPQALIPQHQQDINNKIIQLDRLMRFSYEIKKIVPLCRNRRSRDIPNTSLNCLSFGIYILIRILTRARVRLAYVRSHVCTYADWPLLCAHGRVAALTIHAHESPGDVRRMCRSP